MAPVRAEKKSTFSKLKIRIFRKHSMCKVFALKTVYFAYKPISDSLF